MTVLYKKTCLYIDCFGDNFHYKCMLLDMGLVLQKDAFTVCWYNHYVYSLDLKVISAVIIIYA